MAYSEELAERVRVALKEAVGLSEKRMMGGLCFFVHGNMLASVNRNKDGSDRFMFRVGRENEAKALKRTGARIVEMGKRRMSGFVYVDADDCKAAALRTWLDLSLGFVEALPKK